MADPLLEYLPSQLLVLDLTPIRDLMSPLNNYVNGLEETTGLSADKLNYLAIFLLCYPTAIIHRFIGNTFLRHLYSLVLGLLVVIYMVGNEVYHSLFSCLVAYFVLFFVRGKPGTAFIWAWAFGYMTLSHLYRMYVDYMGWSVDFTIVQMVLTLKMCAIACNIQDGHYPSTDLSKAQKDASISRQEFPSLFHYLSYMFYWCTVLPGPFFEYKEFMSFMDRSMFPNRQVPSGSVVAFLKIWAKLILTFAGVFVAFSVPIHRIVEPVFLEYNFFQKIGYLYISMACLRCNYYTGWLMSEGAIVLNGFGYNGEKDGVTQWNRLTNIHIFHVEIGESLKSMIDNWNLGTARFLKFYVYFRVSRKPTKPGQVLESKPKGLNPEASQLLVFVVSAFWHGFYPGYYFFFVSMFFFKLVSNYMEKITTPRFYTFNPSTVVQKISNAIYSILCTLLSIAVLDYSAIAFVLLSYENALLGYAAYHWSFHIVIGSALLLVKFGILRPVRTPRPVKIE